MKWMRYFVYGSLVLCMALALSGCGWVDELRSYKGTAEGTEQESQPPEGEQGASIVEQRLGLAEDAQSTAEAGAPAAPGGQTPEGGAGQEPDAKSSDSQETKEVLLYFVSADSNALEPELRDIPKETGLARATVNQLLAGPREEDLLPVIPSGVSLRDIDVSEGLCTVDLSAELSELAAISQSEQVLALYSLVNTLSQFDTVDYVQVLINGQQLSDFGGVDASQALAPMDL